MTRKLREVEIPIPEGMQEAILDLPVIQEGEEPTTVGELVRRAHEALLKANETVQNRLPFMDLRRIQRLRSVR